MKKILNNNSLKIIAILSMLLDHVSYLFIRTNNFLYYIFRIIGRICAPIMFFGIANGYKYTSNKKKYGLRLLIFALISQIPYSLFMNDKIFLFSNYNVIFTLFLSFLTILIFDKCDKKIIKYSLMLLCLILSYFCDWGVIGILISLAFYLINERKYAYTIYTLLCIIYITINTLIYKNIAWLIVNIGLFLPILFISLYNDKKGKHNLKYLFYYFYPSHLLVLYLIFKLV